MIASPRESVQNTYPPYLLSFATATMKTAVTTSEDVGGEESKKRTSQTPPLLRSKVSRLNESLIQDGENVFFSDLPNEVLLLTNRIKDESLFYMHAEELEKELYGNLREFAKRLAQSRESTNSFVKETRKDYKSWVKGQKKEQKRQSQKSGFVPAEKIVPNEKELAKRKRNFFLPADCAIPVNSKLALLMRFLNDEMMKVSQMVASIKMWISLKVPRIEDGNNFGVSVQEEYISSLQGMESSVSTIISSISTYLSDRGTLLGNIIRFPEVEDFHRSLFGYDEWNIHQFYIYLVECRNSLALIYDSIKKNINWLYTPRMESDVQHMFI